MRIIIVISLGKDGKEAVSRIIAYPAFGGYQNEIDVIGNEGDGKPNIENNKKLILES